MHTGYHHFDASGVETISKYRGHMYEISAISKCFIDYAPKADGPVLDIGAAYGINTIPALMAGAQVIANDIEISHLNQLRQRTPEALMPLLETYCARFPNEMNFPNESIGGILLSHVFGFLSGDDMLLAVEKIRRWLIPGAKVFVIGYSPYFKDNEAKISIFEKRLANGSPWPGYMTRITERPNLPNRFHSLYPELLKRLFPLDAFEIDCLGYVGYPNTPIPEWLRLDGRENVGLIASKR